MLPYSLIAVAVPAVTSTSVWSGMEHAPQEHTSAMRPLTPLFLGD